MTAPQPNAKAGRPLKFDSVLALKLRVERYFWDCDRQEDTRVFVHGEELIVEIPELDVDDERTVRKELVCEKCRRAFSSTGCTLLQGELKRRRPYTVTGLADWLDTSRQTLLNYECRPEFFDTIKRAKQRIENYAEERLFDKNHPTRGVIFSLSNNADGWAEKIETTVKDERDPADGLLDAASREGDTADDAAPARPDHPSAGSPAGEGHAAVPEVLPAGVRHPGATRRDGREDVPPVPRVPARRARVG